MSRTLPETVAAVDLGSNSFHMIVARVVGADLEIVDRQKEMVRLAAGLDSKGRLSDEARARALACLERFGDLLEDLPPGAVRVIGTNTLRKAKGTGDFLERVEAALGHNVEIVSGFEEARLIYLGVAHDIDDQDRRLVVDIGGGSTETIVGEGFDPLEAHSLHMGCVSWSQRFFKDGRISAKRMRTAQLIAGVELEPIARQLRSLGWTRAIGASGTVTAIQSTLEAEGLSHGGITVGGLATLRQRLIELGHVDRLDSLVGLKPARAPVFPGGVAILSAIFDSLRIDRMDVAGAALREGALHDLLGRHRREDVRERTIRRFCERYAVDLGHASRVERTALSLLEEAGDWDLDRTQASQALRWAARLHEIGLVVSHSSYHKHGAYLIEHSDMPGFSRTGQLLLSTLVFQHRRRIRLELFDRLPPRWRDFARRLVMLLRLAVLLNRARRSKEAPRVALTLNGARLKLRFEEGWLERHPLTAADLEQEQRMLEPVGWTLSFA